MKYTKITISGLICSGKTSVFYALQNELIWPVFSASQFFRNYAKSHNVSLNKAQEQSQGISNNVDYAMRDMLKKEGNLILEGWMAGIMASGQKDVLRLLLYCDDKVRYERFALRESLSLLQAEQAVNEREKNLFEKLQNIYHHHDFINPKDYNLVIDTTKITIRQTVDKVLDALGFKNEE